MQLGYCCLQENVMRLRSLYRRLMMVSRHMQALHAHATCVGLVITLSTIPHVDKAPTGSTSERIIAKFTIHVLGLGWVSRLVYFGATADDNFKQVSHQLTPGRMKFAWMFALFDSLGYRLHLSGQQASDAKNHLWVVRKQCDESQHVHRFEQAIQRMFPMHHQYFRSLYPSVRAVWSSNVGQVPAC